MNIFRFDPTNVEPNLELDLTPLHYAIITGNDELAMKMLDHGVDPNITDW